MPVFYFIQFRVDFAGSRLGWLSNETWSVSNCLSMGQMTALEHDERGCDLRCRYGALSHHVHKWLLDFVPRLGRSFTRSLVECEYKYIFMSPPSPLFVCIIFFKLKTNRWRDKLANFCPDEPMASVGGTVRLHHVHPSTFIASNSQDQCQHWPIDFLVMDQQLPWERSENLTGAVPSLFLHLFPHYLQMLQTVSGALWLLRWEIINIYALFATVGPIKGCNQDNLSQQEVLEKIFFWQ